MAGAAAEGDTGRKASLETRQLLLERLDAPAGSVVIARRPTSGDDVLEVRMRSSAVLPPARRLPTFEGFRVDYLVEQAPKAGRW